jgi:transcriptional regulator with XRE-family HTH domain
MVSKLSNHRVPVCMAIRIHKGWSAAQLAKRAGLSPITIWRLETGRAKPTSETLFAVARALGVKVESLWQ